MLGFEALTRWNRPQFGWVSPLELFPFAEEAGLIDEGVETRAQRDFLLANGCKGMQGYLFAKGLPPNEARELLGNSIDLAPDGGE